MLDPLSFSSVATLQLQPAQSSGTTPSAVDQLTNPAPTSSPSAGSSAPAAGPTGAALAAREHAHTTASTAVKPQGDEIMPRSPQAHPDLRDAAAKVGSTIASPHPSTGAHATPSVMPPPAKGSDSSRQGSWLDTAGAFAKGVGEGAWDGASGMVQGVGDLAKGGYTLATSAEARSQAANTISKGASAAGQFAKTAVTDPAKAAGQVGHAASGAWNSVSTAYQQAAASGHGAEFIGKAVGQGAVLAATLPVGGAEAEGAAALGDAGRLTEAAGTLGKAGDAAATLGKAGDAAANLGKAGDAVGDAGKALHATDAASSNAAAHATGAAIERAAATVESSVGKTAASDSAKTTAIHDRASATERAATGTDGAAAKNATNDGAQPATAHNTKLPNENEATGTDGPFGKTATNDKRSRETVHDRPSTSINKPETHDTPPSSEVNHQVSADRRKHILDGDKTGGGHRAGTGKPGKSEFPSTWSDEKTINNLESVANDPNSSRTAGRNGRTIVRGNRDGIDLEVIVGKNNEIVTGFPTNVSRNPPSLPSSPQSLPKNPRE